MFDIHLYDVTCENKPGSPSQLFILQVMERWRCESLGMNLEFRFNCPPLPPPFLFPVPPVITFPPQSAAVEEGRSVQFLCFGTGVPAPAYSWRR